jgi:UDP-N-acetylmuramoylalanine--D-glutamate ligase
VIAQQGLEQASFRGKRVLVLGLGRFSGGMETVRFLRAEGADVCVSDRSARAALREQAEACEALGAEARFGPQDATLLLGRDVVIANPAIPFDHPLLVAAAERGVPVTTEINIVLARLKAPVYAVTGTKGKSTTSTLLARMLEAYGFQVHLGGNVGRALVAQLDEIGPDHRVVLELSSFQLHHAHALGRSPHVSIVTNLLSDHLDRHGTQDAYAEAKRAALAYQGADDVAVLPADDDAVRAAGWLESGGARRVLFGEGGRFHLEDDRVRCTESGRTAALDGMTLLGAHNRRNALTAAAAVLGTLEDGFAAVADGARATVALPHRLCPVAEVEGVLYLDDSNATHPNSTLAALAALSRPVVLIAGGKDKGADPTVLLRAIRQRVKAVVLIGSSTERLHAGLAGHVPVETANDIETAVRHAAAAAAPGDVVLLSPAYSSLDQFASFAERGDRFQAAVRSLAEST